MEKIKKIAEYIREEIEDAEKYAKCAIAAKDTDRAFADAYVTLSTQELGHVDILHAQATRLIREAQARGQTATAAMQAVWDWEHERQIEAVRDIKMLLQMYREG